MNRLQLSQRLKNEAAVTGTLATTIGQTDMFGQLVEWIDSAYEDIQNRHPNWEFLREDFEFETIASTATYTRAALGLGELANWKKDSLRVYDEIDNEQWLNCLAWDVMRDVRLMGANRTTEGWPIEFAIKPNKSILIWPVPDAVYTVVGEYWQRAQTMTANADEPTLPSRYHMAIVWRALMMYAADQEATLLYQHAEKEFKRVFFALEVDQLPGFVEAEPLL